MPGGDNLLPDLPGFFKQALGAGRQFGEQLGGAILNGIRGGWRAVVDSVGSMLGGNLMGLLGSNLSKSIGGTLGGMIGSVLGPLASMLGGALTGLFGKLFGPTEYEKRVRAEEQQRQEMKSSLNFTELQNQAAFVNRTDLYQGITAGLADKNNPEYIRGLVTELNDKTQQLQAAMDRYGISWDSLEKRPSNPKSIRCRFSSSTTSKP